MKHLMGRQVINHRIYPFYCLDTGKLRESHLMNILLVQSNSVVQSDIVSKLFSQGPPAHGIMKKVVRLVLTHLYSTDKQKLTEVILNKINVEES